MNCSTTKTTYDRRDFQCFFTSSHGVVAPLHAWETFKEIEGGNLA